MSIKVERTRVNKQRKATKQHKIETKQGIQSLNVCFDVQRRRVKNGKNGYSKAVRDFVRHAFPSSYKEALEGLPVRWDFKKPRTQRELTSNQLELVKAKALWNL